MTAQRLVLHLLTRVPLCRTQLDLPFRVRFLKIRRNGARNSGKHKRAGLVAPPDASFRTCCADVAGEKWRDNRAVSSARTAARRRLQAAQACAAQPTTSRISNSTRVHFSSLSTGFAGICWGLALMSKGARAIVEKNWKPASSTTVPSMSLSSRRMCSRTCGRIFVRLGARTCKMRQQEVQEAAVKTR